MPHQCLKCGKTFESGSSQLLKGCPDCNGNRFFYTKEPLDDKERKTISDGIEKDITEQIIDLIGDQGEEVVDKSGKWVNVKPKEIRKAVEKLSEQKEKEEDIKEESVENEYREAILEKLKADQNHSDVPETIGIEKSGSYKIDLKGLLEEEPIIIQKDGSYTIHLPSIFKMINKEK